jgi:acetyltransferase-like isoleucine patch superfamily enzyme
VTISKLIIVGEGITLDLAVSIAERARYAQRIEVEYVASHEIAAKPLDFLGEISVESTKVFAAIGSQALNYARFDLWAKLRLRGLIVATLIDPSACVIDPFLLGENCLVGPLASIGKGVSVGAGTVVEAGARLSGMSGVGKFTWIGANATLNSSASLGDHSVLGAGTTIDTGVRIGKHCDICALTRCKQNISDGTFISDLFDQPVRLFNVSAANSK